MPDLHRESQFLMIFLLSSGKTGPKWVSKNTLWRAAPRANQAPNGFQEYPLEGRTQGKTVSLESATAADCSEKFRKSL